MKSNNPNPFIIITYWLAGLSFLGALYLMGQTQQNSELLSDILESTRSIRRDAVGIANIDLDHLNRLIVMIRDSGLPRPDQRFLLDVIHLRLANLPTVAEMQALIDLVNFLGENEGTPFDGIGNFLGRGGGGGGPPRPAIPD